MSIYKEKLTLVLLIIFTIIVYYLSSHGETVYNYFFRLSESLLSGKLYLQENPSWLNELILVDNKYYVVYPPMPALLMLPLEFISKGAIPQTAFSILLGGINIGLTFLMLRRIDFSFSTSLLVALFFAFGTNHWYLSSIGSAWYLAHVVAIFFVLLALLETFGKQRLFLIGIFLGAAFWSRTPVIFTLPFFYIYLYKKLFPLSKEKLFNFLILNIGVGSFVLIDAYYNFVRFNRFSPFVPYQLIPHIENDPVFQDGFMSVNFIPRHLKALFTTLPKFQNTFPFIIPPLYSLAIWIISPALIYIFKVPKNILTISCWIGITLPLSVIFLWAGVGYSQFGYRFLQDVMPFLLILTALGIGRNPSKIAYLLVILSIIVNLWGVILINKLGINTFI